MDGQVLQFRLRGGSDAVPAARGVLDRVAEEYELPSYGDLRLLISELVTNSVVHGEIGREDWVDLRLREGSRAIRVEVCNEGRDWNPQPRDADLEEPGGWGLFIVERLSDRWGVVGDGETCVWFELDHEGPVLRKREPCRNGSSETPTHLVRAEGGAPAVCGVCGELVTYSEGFARRAGTVLHLSCLEQAPS